MAGLPVPLTDRPAEMGGALIPPVMPWTWSRGWSTTWRCEVDRIAAEGGKTVAFLRAEQRVLRPRLGSVAGRRRRVLFDAGITADGLIGNLDRLTISPDTFEAAC